MTNVGCKVQIISGSAKSLPGLSWKLLSAHLLYGLSLDSMINDFTVFT